jgi:hypothetical protein
VFARETGRRCMQRPRSWWRWSGNCSWRKSCQEKLIERLTLRQPQQFL